MSAYNKNPDITEMQRYFGFYAHKVLPHVELCSTQNTEGCHALHTHTSAVVFRGIDYALSLDKNPTPVIFAGAFHDMARTHDGWDTHHGEKAIPNAKKIMREFTDVLTENDMANIIYAIANHTTGTVAPDYVSACLWDADRTRMSWVYGYESKHFNTSRAKYVASHPYQDYINFQQQCVPVILWSHEY